MLDPPTTGGTNPNTDRETKPRNLSSRFKPPMFDPPPPPAENPQIEAMFHFVFVLRGRGFE